ncbi:MAG: membrane dipeptidase [Prevotella sp.]|nr:membrane dipeptidase [Prevotella sp.]
MNRFSIQEHIDSIYDGYPAGERKPVIGITANYDAQSSKLAEGYYKQVKVAGGTPLIIPPLSDRCTLMSTLDHIDGLLLSGGADINPLYCGEEPSPFLHGINAERDLPELLITRLAFNRQLPILGICRGIQTLAIALGGKVAQDIESEKGKVNSEKGIKHSQDADRSEPTHSVSVANGSTLFNIYNDFGPFIPTYDDRYPGTLPVNSFHHQAVIDPGPHFRIAATAPDGVIEAIESCEMKPIVGVQWHPECMDEDGLPLFRWLVYEARQYRKTQQVHDHVLTLDTHCDTPMFFPQNINFARRDDRILVDLHKMTEGRLDATIMVAYLPQPKMGETFSSKVSFPVKGPKEYADLIFDKIGEIVEHYDDYLALARTPGDLYENKRHGRKSIMLGIENGLALGGQLQNVSHFAERGVVYITLCHNGDNDLCDSCRGSNVHGGVSRFGEQVIREMNRLGLMVDLSHAGDKSFFDALEISKTPIVCTHSSCRALCDHPRNLTDEQMRRLAQAGGVMQVTLYNGFLRKDGKATILDAIDHLEHAIKVMGIDHVGLGTDFDGDGGVPGLANASELTLFTYQLLQRSYSERDIQKIWGGNFLRVMGQVQRMKE